MKFKENARYDLIAPTSMGLRITPVNRQPVHISKLYEMHVTSAESNVLNVSASLGLNTKVLTTFVKDSPMSTLIKAELRRRNIEYEGVDVDKEGPWGYRHQINIADSGYGLRGPRVDNDRSGEVGRTLNVKDFDLEKLFKEDGVKLMHISGLIAALSPETSEFCLELARYGKKYGTKISFDLNYRETFWKGRKEELRAAFKEIASLSDVLIGNEEDYQLALGVEGPEAGGENIADEIDVFKQLINNVKKEYPNASLYANTLREVLNANEHLWGATVLEGDELTVVEPRPIQVLDRIGGGDGFVGGLLYGLLNGFPGSKAVKFAWASGALATTMIEDYGTPADEEQIWSIWEGNARVQR